MRMFAEVQGVVNPITTKLYSSGAGSGASSDEEDPIRDHDEL